MKKIWKLILILIIMFCLASCKKQTKIVKILIPEGIPAIAVGALLDNENYEFTVVNGSSVLSTELMQNNYDVIVAPIILGAQLYLKNASNYKLNYILTTGNSYIVYKAEKDINNLKDLEGKTIASFGQNTAPDIMLKAAIESQKVDINKIEFVYENSVADVLTNRFLSGENVDAILCAEPVVSKIEIALKNKVGETKKIDLQEVLKQENELEIIPQAGIFVNKNIDEKTVKNLLLDIEKNVSNLNQNTEEYVDELLTKNTDLKEYFNGLGKQILVNAIPRSNIVFLNAIDDKNTLDNYFNLINKYNEKILNKGTINEEFYKK